MIGEIKQIWKLIWENRQYRKAFGLHPVFLALYLSGGVIFGMLPLFFHLAGEEFKAVDCFMTGFVPAFLYLILFVNFGTQHVIMFSSGKSLCSLPMAKEILTRGILLSRLLSLSVLMLPTVLLSELWVLTGVCKKVMTDDVLFMFGITYLITALAAGVTFMGVLFGVSIGVFSVYNAIEKPFHSLGTSKWLEKLYAYEMSWWLAAVAMILLLGTGYVLGRLLLERAYRKRRVIVLLDQRAMQRY